jgi:hypothetical protein
VPGSHGGTDKDDDGGSSLEYGKGGEGGEGVKANVTVDLFADSVTGLVLGPNEDHQVYVNVGSTPISNIGSAPVGGKGGRGSRPISTEHRVNEYYEDWPQGRYGGGGKAWENPRMIILLTYDNLYT